MKKFLWLAFLLAFLPKAHAATCTTLSSGATQTNIQSALTNCHSGDTVALAAGTYGPLVSRVTIPCGVSISGPNMPYSQTPNQTATILGSSSSAPFWGFETTPGCNTGPQTIQYLEWNGEQPPATCAQGSGGKCGGGGFLHILAGTNNLTVQYNWLHGVNAPNADACGTINAFSLKACATANSEADLIYLDGGSNSTVTQNVTIQWNIGGSMNVSDCGGSNIYGAMQETDTETDAGYCGLVGMHNNLANVSVINNIAANLEEPIKFFENEGYCNPVVVSYNWLSNYRRIGYETQCNIGGAGSPVNMTIDYNVVGTRYGGATAYNDPNGSGYGQQNYDISAANGCSANSYLDCVTHTDYNLALETVNLGHPDVGFEIWGGCGPNKNAPDSSGTTANSNFIQGYFANSISWSKNGCMQFNSNLFNISSANVKGTDCQTANGGYWSHEQSGTTYSPSCANNSYSNAITGTTTSATPMFSPAGGAVANGTTVTIATSGSGLNANTSNWCTTNGSNPVPGMNGSIMTSYTVTAPVTLKCVGMWGAANQPHSYPSGYGYVASPVEMASYNSATGNPTITGGQLGNPGSVNTVAVSAAPIQFTATATYSDGIGRTLPDKYGNTAVWTSSNSSILSVGSTGLVSCISAGTANVQVNVNTSNGLRLNLWGMTCSTSAGRTIASGYLGNQGSINTLAVGASAIQFTATVIYSDKTTGPLPDTSGNTAVWSSSNSSILSVGSSGLVSCISGGTANVQVNVNTSNGLRLNVWGMTCSAPAGPTITGGYLGNQGSINTLAVGAPAIQFTAFVVYSNKTTGQLPDTNGNTAVWSNSNSSILSVGSSGLVSCIKTGTANVQANVNTSSGFRLNVWGMTCK